MNDPKLPNMAADFIKNNINYEVFKISLQHVELESKHLKEWVEFYHRDNDLLHAETKELIEATQQLMSIFGIKTAKTITKISF